MKTVGGTSDYDAAMAALINADAARVENYHFRCQCCRYGRSFGKCKLTMESQALRHAMHKGGHALQLMADGWVYRIIDYSPRQVIQSKGDNSIPF